MNSPLDHLAAAMPAGFLPMLTSDTRLYRVEGGGRLASVHVEAFTLHEALHEPWQMVLSCLSDTPLPDMAALRWQPVTLVTALADGSEHRRTGLIEQAAVTDVGLSFGRPSRYRFTVVPWLGLLAYDWRSQVYQERTLVEIVDSVLCHYGAHGRWRWSACATAWLAGAPQGGRLSYCMQYRESRLRFVQRLLAEAGLTYRFEETGIGEPATLVIMADTTSADSCPEDVSSASVWGGAGLRFHRAGPTEQQDGVTQFDASFHWGASTLTASSSDYKTGQVVSASVPTLGRVGGPNAAVVESYVYAGAYAWPDSDAARRGLTAVQQAIEARRRTWSGRSGVRSLSAGTHIVMRDTRMDDLGALTTQRPACLVAPDNRYLLTQITHVGINNLPSELLDRLGGVDADPLRRPGVDEIAELPGVDAELKREAALRGYANRFEAADASMPWRPMMADADPGRMAPRPRIPGPLVATVVGPDGATEPSGPDELYMDKLGRVRIRFEFQGHPGNDALASLGSTWVRVLQPVAGPGLGAQWVPRIGHEVLVGFMDDDADRPMVIRSLHNGRGEGGVPATPGGQGAEPDTSVFATSTNHRPGGQGNLTAGASPAWHGGAPQSLQAGGHNNAAALSGIKTKEFGGEGFNQTVFDDTDGELRTQLATTQHASQLNLGHLIHQADNHRGSFRGRGFELRTDAYGALRGARSVHLTSYGSAASEPALDQAGGMALARQYQQLTQAFSQAARAHQTVRLSAHEGSHQANASLAHAAQAPAQAWLTNVSGMADASASQAPEDAASRLTTPADGKLPHPTDPTLSIAARAGLVATAGQDIALTASDGVSLASGGTADAAVGGAWRIHTGQAIGVLCGAIEPSTAGAVPPAKGSGLTLIAGNGDLSLQAQAGTMQLAAKGDLAVQSASAAVDFTAAKRIVIANAHGANITIADGKIVVTCPGTYTVKAGQKSLTGPASVSVTPPRLPRAELSPRGSVPFSL
ncbi:MAG: type VI secretion system Vgr family protein [Burkholderiaceae bacterium]